MQPLTPIPHQREPHLLRYYPVFLVVVLALGLQIIGEPAFTALRYERQSIISGELWRAISGHFVHTGWVHTCMDVAGLLIIGLGFPGSQGHRPLRFAAYLILLACGISTALWQASPAVHWYVGLSGILYGLLMISAIEDWRRNRLLSMVLIIAVGAKLVREQTGDAASFTSAMIGACVIGDVHLYGGITGLLIAFGGRFVWGRHCMDAIENTAATPHRLPMGRSQGLAQTAGMQGTNSIDPGP